MDCVLRSVMLAYTILRAREEFTCLGSVPSMACLSMGIYLSEHDGHALLPRTRTRTIHYLGGLITPSVIYHYCLSSLIHLSSRYNG